MRNHIKAFIDSEIEAFENKYKAAEFILNGGRASEAERKFNFKLDINGLNLLCKKANPDTYKTLREGDDNFTNEYSGKTYYNKPSLNQLQDHKHLFLGDDTDTDTSEPEETKRDKWLWDGKEELKVGMWVYSKMSDEECEIKILTNREFAYIDSISEIRADEIDWALPIKPPTDKKKLIDEYRRLSRYLCIEDVLSNFYDEAIKTNKRI